MSKTIDRALEQVQLSNFIWKDESHTTFEVRDAVVVWPNFRGEPNRFGSTKKNFNLVLCKEMADQLAANGWNVKQIVGKDDDGNPDPSKVMLFINVTVKMDSKFPPSVALFTQVKGERRRTALDEESIGTLDRITFEKCDCTIRGYSSTMFKGKTTAYLTKMFVMQEQDVEYGGAWDDWLSSDIEDEHNYNPDGDM